MEFKWLNESKVIKEGNKIQVFATPESDFFIAARPPGTRVRIPHRSVTHRFIIRRSRVIL